MSGDNVIQFPTTDGNLACQCGSQWWTANVCLTTDMKLSAINDAKCHECDKELE